MKKKFILILIVFAISFLGGSFANAYNTNKLIRVGISSNDFSKLLYNETNITSNADFYVVDKQSKKKLLSLKNNEILNIKYNNQKYILSSNNKQNVETTNNLLEIKTQHNDGNLQIVGLKRAGIDVSYDGTIELIANKTQINKFAIVNVVPLENYLKSVVPNEMPVRFGLEALKAQSVAARNYVLKPREKFYKEFDVCDSTASQVYYGVSSRKPLSNQAVDETKGVVALYKDELILALYCSTIGGYSESYKNAFSVNKPKIKFPSHDIPYLKAKPDNINVQKLETEGLATWFYTNKIDSFDVDSPYYRWATTWTGNELEDILKKRILQNINSGFIHPKVEKNFDFGKLKDIKVLERGESGKIISMDIIFDNITFNVKKELIIRKLFLKNNKMLKSANCVFQSIYNKENLGENSLKNAFYQFEKDEFANNLPVYFDEIKAIGGGFGHGVGLSQFGAANMAKRGYNYEQILKHYYSHINLGTVPHNLTYADNEYLASFFTKDKNACIVFENNLSFAKIKAEINNNTIEINLNPAIIRHKEDISKYLLLGENKIKLTLIKDEKNLNKVSIKTFVEFNCD